MRTRNRNTPYTAPPSEFIRYTPEDTVVNGYGYRPGFTFKTLDETIIDLPSGKRGAMKPCVHDRNKVYLRTIGGVRHEIGSAYGAGWYDLLSDHHLLAYGKLFYGDPGSLSPRGVTVNWQSESAQAWDKMKPGITTEISTLNFLYEFREIKRLFDIWSKKRARIKNLANAHLNYSFGWAPLISDTESLLALMVDFNQKWNQLVENANKPLTRHYSRTLDPGYTNPPWEANLGTSCWKYECIDVHEETKYHATAQYTYSIPTQWRNVPARFVAMMDAYGLNLNPAIIWNAIPYSFALDWITNLGSWLNTWTVKALTLNIELTGFCQSVSSRASRSVEAYNVLPDGILPRTVVWTEEASHYERRITYPGVLSLPRARAPRWGALALASSLAIAKTKPKRPRKEYLLVPSRIYIPRKMRVV
jgi:hypothetical protein